jgi:hypothetical protein
MHSTEGSLLHHFKNQTYSNKNPKTPLPKLKKGQSQSLRSNMKLKKMKNLQNSKAFNSKSRSNLPRNKFPLRVQMIKNIYNNNNNLSFRRQNPKLKHQKMSK